MPQHYAIRAAAQTQVCTVDCATDPRRGASADLGGLLRRPRTPRLALFVLSAGSSIPRHPPQGLQSRYTPEIAGGIFALFATMRDMRISDSCTRARINHSAPPRGCYRHHTMVIVLTRHALKFRFNIEVGFCNLFTSTIKQLLTKLFLRRSYA